MDILVIIMIVAAIVWLITQFAPLHGWVGKAALIVWVGCVTLLLAGARITTG